MGRIILTGALVLVAPLSLVVASEPQDEGSKTERQSTLKAVSALAGQAKVERAEPESAPAKPAGGVRAVKAIAGNADVVKLRPNELPGQAVRQEPVRGRAGGEKVAGPVQGQNQAGRQRQIWVPAGGFDGPLDFEPWGFQQWGANPGFAQRGGGVIWSPAPYQPAFFGGGMSYRAFGYGGFGYQGLYSDYGYFFPSPVVGSVSGPIITRYPDPLGRQWKMMNDAINKAGGNPTGLERPAGF